MDVAMGDRAGKHPARAMRYESAKSSIIHFDSLLFFATGHRHPPFLKLGQIVIYLIIAFFLTDVHNELRFIHWDRML
jgi:hypothetical protein